MKNLTYANGAVWAAAGERGQVVRIDPTTNDTHTFRIGHDVADVDVAHGLVAAGVQPSAADVTASLKGDHRPDRLEVELALRDRGPTLPSTDPALYAPWDKNMQQVDYATCARLYNYPRRQGCGRPQDRARGGSRLPASVERRSYVYDRDPARLPLLAALERGR